MGKRSYNPCLAKTHQSYKVGEIADIFGVHKDTVLIWKKQGLPTTDNFKPFLIQGQELRKFLKERRNKNKCKCQIDEIYCVRCRAPKKPLGNMVDYKPSIQGGLSNIMGLCPDCGSRIFRRTSERTLELIRHYLDVTIPITNQRIDAVDLPIINSDFNQGE